MRVILFLFFVWVGMTSKAFAHDWYDAACCNTQDCAMIEVENVKMVPGGYIVQLEAGDHFMVTTGVNDMVRWDERRLRQSQDDHFHACVRKWTQTIICLYVPGMVG